MKQKLPELKGESDKSIIKALNIRSQQFTELRYERLEQDQKSGSSEHTENTAQQLQNRL